MLNNFIYAKTKDLFLEYLNLDAIPSDAIVFIEDTREIWNHGTYFDGRYIDLSDIETAISELQLNKVNRSDLDIYATKDELPDMTETLKEYLKKEDTDALYATIVQHDNLNDIVSQHSTTISNLATNESLKEVSDSVDSLTSVVNNKVNPEDLNNYYTKNQIDDKGFLVNDDLIDIQTDISNLKLIGAEKNVQSDWSESDNTSDAFIKNKPNLSEYLKSSDAATTYAPISLSETVEENSTSITELSNTRVTIEEFEESLSYKLSTNDASNTYVNKSVKINGVALNQSEINITATDPNAAKQSDLEELTITVDDKANKSDLNNLSQIVEGLENEISNKANSTDLNNYYTKIESDNKYLTSNSEVITNMQVDISTKFTTPSEKTLSGFGIVDGFNNLMINGSGNFVVGVEIDDVNQHQLNITKGNVDLSGCASVSSVNDLNTSVSNLTTTVSALENTTVPDIGNRLTTLESYFSTTEDTDNVINKWFDIIEFLDGISEGNTEGEKLASILETKANKSALDAIDTNLTNLTSTVNSHINNSSVTKSGETLTVTIGNTSESLTNSWREISDKVDGTSSLISASEKAVATTYALANTANTTADMVKAWGNHADAGYVKSSGVTNVVAGNGLIGGGSNAEITINVGAGTGISVTDDAINVTYGTTSGTACEGNDSRLSDARKASDVYEWAKASVKPTYTSSEVGAVSVNGGNISGNLNVSGYVTEGMSYSTTLGAVPITAGSCRCSISSSQELALIDIPEAGRTIHILIKNESTSTRTVVLPNSGFYVSFSGTSLSIPGGGFAEVSVFSDGERMFIRAGR